MRTQAFEFCQKAISSDSDTPILQTDASDYGIGGYLYTVRDDKVRVVRFFSKKECYGLYYGVKLFEAELDGRYFILATDHMNLTYINTVLTGKVLRWKLYLQDKNFDFTYVKGKSLRQFVPDALSRLCENNMSPQQLSAMLASLQPIVKIPLDVYKEIARVHNSAVGHWGLMICKKRLNNASISDRMITQFIRQCPCCQVMSRLKVPILTHPFTCASYNPFEVIHLDHIGPLKKDDHGYEYILVLIDAFSRWIELFPTKSTTALETATCVFQHFGRFGAPEVVHTDRGPAFHNELIEQLLKLSGVEQSLTTAYSKEENAIVERANQEVLRHLNAILFDVRVHNAWSFDQLPMVQRIMNTVEKTTTGITPAELILNNSIRLSPHILAAPAARDRSSRVALSDTLDSWIEKQHTLLKAARANQLNSDFHLLVEYDPRITEYPIHSYVLFTPPVGRSNKLLPRHRGPYQVMEKTDSIYTIEDLVSGKRITTHIHNLRPFVYDPDRTSPHTVAQHNEQEFVIESVLAHRGDRNRRSTLEFHIRWAGFGEAHDSWEPYKALLHTTRLHDYLRAHQMKTLIPKEYK